MPTPFSFLRTELRPAITKLLTELKELSHLEKSALVTAIIGAMMVCSNTHWTWWGYVFFTYNSGVFFYLSAKKKYLSFMLANLIFIIADMIGLYRFY